MTIQLPFRSMSLAVSLLAATAVLAPISATASDSIQGQLDTQLEQLKPQHFNYHSDVYRQVTSHKSVSKKLSVKHQLDSQKALLRHQHIDPRSDVFLQLHRGA